MACISVSLSPALPNTSTTCPSGSRRAVPRRVRRTTTLSPSVAPPVNSRRTTTLSRICLSLRPHTMPPWLVMRKVPMMVSGMSSSRSSVLCSGRMVRGMPAGVFLMSAVGFRLSENSSVGRYLPSFICFKSPCSSMSARAFFAIALSRSCLTPMYLYICRAVNERSVLSAKACCTRRMRVVTGSISVCGVNR